MIVATRPTTSPSASIRCHFFSTSAGFADLVVFISAFMAIPLLECERRHPNGGAGERAICGQALESQAKQGISQRVICYRTQVLRRFSRLSISCRRSRE